MIAGLQKWPRWNKSHLLIFLPLLVLLPSTLKLGWPMTCINQWNAAEMTMQDFGVQPLRIPGSFHLHNLMNPKPSCPKSYYPCGIVWTGQMKRRQLRIHRKGENTQCPCWASIWLHPHERPQPKSVGLWSWTQLKSPTHKSMS